MRTLLAIIFMNLVSLSGFAASYPVGIYNIDGPTGDIGDKNVIAFATNGDATLIHHSWGQRLECKGKFLDQNGVLRVSGVCDNSQNFEMLINMEDVSDLSYFRAKVKCETIYPQEVEMRFMLLKK